MCVCIHTYICVLEWVHLLCELSYAGFFSHLHWVVNFTSGLSLPFEQYPLYLRVKYENYISQRILWLEFDSEKHIRLG